MQEKDRRDYGASYYKVAALVVKVHFEDDSRAITASCYLDLEGSFGRQISISGLATRMTAVCTYQLRLSRQCYVWHVHAIYQVLLL